MHSTTCRAKVASRCQDAEVQEIDPAQEKRLCEYAFIACSNVASQSKFLDCSSLRGFLDKLLEVFQIKETADDNSQVMEIDEDFDIAPVPQGQAGR